MDNNNEIAAALPCAGPTVVIACRVMEPELSALKKDRRSSEIRYLDQGYHVTPDRLPPLLQEEVDQAAKYAGRIVLGYGLCANAITGVVAPRQGLFVPRVHDCIALFFGSTAAYERAMDRRPGTFFLTAGWIAAKGDPLGYMEEKYLPRLGREMAEWGIREELKNYTHIALIDTRTGDLADSRLRAKQNARFLDKQYEELNGSGEYLRKLLQGPYDAGDFFFFAAGSTVTQDRFLERRAG